MKITDQTWVRHPENPVISLRPGCFDSNHVHAPMVVREEDGYLMWYSGSDREFNEYHRIGFAESPDGVRWERRREPVLVPPGPKGYYTTPSILRNSKGEVLREDGLYRMWFTGGPFAPDLHLATSPDGVDWTLHSNDPIARGVYCPSVLYEDGSYRMWYTHAAEGIPMVIKHSASEDGVSWDDEPVTVMVRTEPWEHRNLLYPFVLKRAGLYEMYYTSYGSRICELALATSEDGLDWAKGGGPILSPDPSSPWDSLYCSNASIIVEPGGRDRMYYASRIDMVHKYYAIGLAVHER